MHFADLFIIKRKHKPLSSQLSQHPNFLFFPQISICPLSSCSSSRTRERERERENSLPPEEEEEEEEAELWRKDTFSSFSHRRRARALPEKEKSIKRTPRALFFPQTSLSPKTNRPCSRKQRSWSELFYARKPGR